MLCILYLRKSINKTYIISDDLNQCQLHKNYVKNYKLKFLKIPISLNFLELIFKNFSLPKKILNLLFTIASQVTYNNQKIKKELNFKIFYSLKKLNNF